MSYKLTDEITDLYTNYNEEIYYIEHLETEFRFKFLLILKLSQLTFSKEEFEMYVDNFKEDQYYNIFEKDKKVNLAENIVERIEYKDRFDGGCIIKVVVQQQYEDLVYNLLDNIYVNDSDIVKYELKKNIINK